MSTENTVNVSETTSNVSTWLIRDLVDQYPDTMAVLAPFGIDLCCGGGRALGEALDLHGAPREETLSSIQAVIDRQGTAPAGRTTA
jgi:iron-sulfur cluster repair protein YtfE (RIC family)